MCCVCKNNPCLGACPNANESKIKGRCLNCKDNLREDYEYYIDDENNTFCSLECAVEHHEIRTSFWCD